MLFRQIVDEKLAQYAYLVGCQRTKEALLIDPERDVDRYLEIADAEGFEIVAVAETHIHADFLSGAREFAERGVRVYLSDEGDEAWKYRWIDDSRYDVTLLRDGDVIRLGLIELKAVHTPGHTPEHLSFQITDHGGGASDPMGVVTGDFVFVGDLGRPDLLESAAGIAGQQEPSARRLFDSVQEFLELPDFMQVWPGHGAGSACGKSLGAIPQSTVGYERRFNAAIDAVRRGRDRFVVSILDGQPEPPLYFARMKRLNRDGAPLLKDFPSPRYVPSDELATVTAEADLQIIDTRLDRVAFSAQHLPGSFYASLSRSFPTDVGSVADPEKPILLVVDSDRVREAVLDLIRIGFDDIRFYTTPGDLADHFAAGGQCATIHRVDFDDLGDLKATDDRQIVDVRYANEFDSAHIPGAINLPYTRLASRLEEIPKASEYFVHCASGARSMVSAALLAREGLRVTYVDGSFAEWWARRQKQEESSAATA